MKMRVAHTYLEGHPRQEALTGIYVGRRDAMAWSWLTGITSNDL